MSSYTNKAIVCTCCGFQYKAKLLKGFYLSTAADLDTCVHHPAVYDQVIECPHCGYATDQISAAIDKDVINFVRSPEYQEIVHSNAFSDVFRKNYLCALIYEQKHNYKKAAQHYLYGYWISRDEANAYTNLLHKVVAHLKRHLETNMDIPAAMMMIDCMRQMSDYNEAEETALSLRDYIHNEYEKKLVDFELVLIHLKDNKPHSQSEVVS